MSNVIEMKFQNTNFKAMEMEGTVYFLGKQVADFLGYTNPSKALNDHCKSLKMLKHNDSLALEYGLDVPPRGLLIIPEPDLYRLIVRSKKPEAEQFEEWVMSEVLPRIRKTGGYIEGEENFQSEDELIYHAMQVMQRKITEMKPKAAWYDEYVSNDGTLNTTDVAKQLGVSAIALNKWMREQGIKFKNKDMPKRAFADWFKVVNFNSNGKVGTQSRITTEGAVKITEMYKEA